MLGGGGGLSLCYKPNIVSWKDHCYQPLIIVCMVVYCCCCLFMFFQSSYRGRSPTGSFSSQSTSSSLRRLPSVCPCVSFFIIINIIMLAGSSSIAWENSCTVIICMIHLILLSLFGYHFLICFLIFKVLNILLSLLLKKKKKTHEN